MKIKDLTGLSKPLTKLIEVIADGIGTITKPILIKKTADAKAYGIKAIADAKAYEIRVITQEIKESQQGVKLIDYSSKKTAISSLDIPLLQQEMTLNDRALLRNDYQEQKRQFNIEEITQKAADQLKDVTEVSDEPVDKDWTTRFFNYAQDVSDEEMQNLWAQILAGEVKKPKSFSLRTLELLKNITKEEAEIFVKFAKIRLYGLNANFVYNPDHDQFLKDNFNISFADKLTLVELGLSYSESEVTWGIQQSPNDNTVLIKYGSKVIVLTKKANSPKKTIDVIVFTKTGSELANLVAPEFSQKYLEKLCSALANSDIEVSYGDIKTDYGNSVDIINIIKFVPKAI